MCVVIEGGLQTTTDGRNVTFVHQVALILPGAQ